MGAAQHHRAHSASLTIWSSPWAQLSITVRASWSSPRAQLSVTTGILTNLGFYLGVKNARLTACRTYPWSVLGGGYLNGWATFV